MTALGPVTPTRLNIVGAEGSSFPADDRWGLDGFLTRRASRLATLAGPEHSFDQARRMLQEFCGWTVDAEVVRRTTHRQARRVRQQRPEQTDTGSFTTPDKPLEVQIDAGKVNTLDGWRDFKIAMIHGRPLGLPATPDEWSSRRLPPPTRRQVICEIEPSELFGQRLRQETDRLGMTAAADVTVVGDGAEWIWNLASEQLPQAMGVPDVFHAMEHPGTVAKAVWGEGTTVQADRLAEARLGLLERGKSGVDDWLGRAFAATTSESAREVVRATAVYFAKHPARLGYAARLASGRSIGSGAVEGAIKQLANRRLKRSGARWRAEHVGPLVELRAFSQSQEWNHYWAAA